MMLPRRPSESGLSLFELLVALGIFVSVAAGISEVLTSTSTAYSTGMTTSGLESQARRVLDRLASDIQGAGVATLVPVPDLPFGSTTLTFQQPAGFSVPTQSVTWGTATRYEIRDAADDVTDGFDNDRDGLVDERELVQIRNLGEPDEQIVVLFSAVSRYLEGEIPNGLDDNGNGLIDEEGLAFSLNGIHLTIHLTVAGRSTRGMVIQRTLDTTVVLRN